MNRWGKTLKDRKELSFGLGLVELRDLRGQRNARGSSHLDPPQGREARSDEPLGGRP